MTSNLDLIQNKGKPICCFRSYPIHRPSLFHHFKTKRIQGQSIVLTSETQNYNQFYRIQPLPLTGLQDRTKMASGLEDFDFLELRVYDIHGFARGRVIPKSAIKDVIKNGTRVSGCKGHPYHLITSGQE